MDVWLDDKMCEQNKGCNCVQEKTSPKDRVDLTDVTNIAMLFCVGDRALGPVKFTWIFLNDPWWNDLNRWQTLHFQVISCPILV